MKEHEHITDSSEDWEQAAENTAEKLLDHVEEWLAEAGGQPETIALVLYKMAAAIPERCLGIFDSDIVDTNH